MQVALQIGDLRERSAISKRQPLLGAAIREIVLLEKSGGRSVPYRR